MSFERWRGRAAVITGASSGIGQAIARDLAARGMRVVLGARREDKVAALARELGPKATAVACDVRDLDSVRGLFREVDALGGADVLVNNAGLGISSPLIGGEPEAWRQMVETNVLGLCMCTREAIEGMKAHGREGHIVHISSLAAYRVPPGGGVYSATKYAVRALTEALRCEIHALDLPIRVTAISPGLVETNFASIYTGREEHEVYRQYKVLDAEQVAEAVAYALAQPPHCQVHDLLLRPLRQPN